MRFVVLLQVGSARVLLHSIKYLLPCIMELITSLVGGLRLPDDVAALILDFVVPMRSARLEAFCVLASRIRAARACDDICLCYNHVIVEPKVVAVLLRPFVSKRGLVRVRHARLWHFLRAQSRARGRLRLFVRDTVFLWGSGLACGVRALPCGARFALSRMRGCSCLCW